MERFDASAAPADTDAQEILAVERGPFERWAKGDLNGFLEASDPEVNYFDPFLAARLDGLPALRALYDKAQGKTQVDPTAKGRTVRWNTTEVYCRKERSAEDRAYALLADETATGGAAGPGIVPRRPVLRFASGLPVC